ncbi:DUF2238 domain-containing protein [Nocardia inohanensis]|uniref:DUF2238 domain-containing protein n=1 Tax=Nocardia inohanensis TaxID=209246 RepID=UPI000836BBA1|nr:DUF2238 domain-containing protein [Nocardia inohanensis]
MVFDRCVQRLSRAAIVRITLFLVLHTIGARYLYSFVPYADWLADQWGIEIGGGRNNYDRFVHFAYGVLLTPVYTELLDRAPAPRRRRLRELLGIAAVLVTSVGYEGLEAAIAWAASPETADSYNGQQGDRLDPYRDVLAALLGGTLAYAVAIAGPVRPRTTGIARAARP